MIVDVATVELTTNVLVYVCALEYAGRCRNGPRNYDYVEDDEDEE